MRLLHLGAAALSLMALASPALAGPSSAIFAYTDSTAAGSVVLTVTTASGPVMFDATVAGSYDSTGGLITGRYLAGVCGSSDACMGDDLTRRDFFVFDLSSLKTTAIGASLALYNPDVNVLPGSGFPVPAGYISATPSLSYTSYGVTSAIDPVSGVSAAIDPYGSLASGAVYATTTVTPADDGKFVNVALDAAALAGINAGAGGDFSIGGAVTPTAVPEPVSLALFGLGVSALAMARRARAD